MTPTRSAIASASSWSWVTNRVVVPTSSWIRRISSRSCDADLGVQRGQRLVEQQHLRLGSPAPGPAPPAAAGRRRAGAGSGRRGLPRPTSSSMLVGPSRRARRRRRRAAAARTRRSRARSGAGTGCRPGTPCPCRACWPAASVMSLPSTRTRPRVGVLEPGERRAARWSCRSRTGRAARRARPGASVEVEPVERAAPRRSGGCRPSQLHARRRATSGVVTRRRSPRPSLRTRRARRRRGADEGQQEQQHEREQQRGQRRPRPTSPALRLPSRLIDHLQGVEVEQRGDGELAEHQRHREERRGEHGATRMFGHHDPPASRSAQHAPRLRAASASVRRRSRDSPASMRPVGVRQHQDRVGEGQRQRRVAEEVGRPRRRPGPARRPARSPGWSAAAGRGTRPARRSRGSRSRTQIIGRHQQHQHAAATVSSGQLERRRRCRRTGRVGLRRAAPVAASSRLSSVAADAAGGELEHREQRQQEEDAEHEQRPRPSGTPAPAPRRRRRSAAAIATVRRCSRA